VLDVLKASKSTEDDEVSFHVVRVASVDDHGILARQTHAAAAEFAEWNRRIAKWGIDVQLVELERTLDDDKLILYVLNERGPECTRLAIQAAAEGLGIIEVQPVAREGLVPPEPKGGCGSCDCSH
jgi:cell fate regulator YaaT (PSP1 superfamily)